MKRATYVGSGVGVLALTIACGRILSKQRQQATALRVERETLRLELAQLESIKTENFRLRALQIPRAELEMMRADHEALPRLRAEIEAMNKAMNKR